jgi:hypothetical protein
VLVGNGWHGFVFAGIAAWDGDGDRNLVARDNTGVL